MGIGGGPGVGGSAQPPQIRESETTAFVEIEKKALGMVPGDTLEVIPFYQPQPLFSQPIYDATFKYRTEPNRPLLHPLLHLRMSTLPEERKEETWEPAYRRLVDSLPTELREWMLAELGKLLEERDVGAVVLNQLLIATAKGVNWLTVATQPIAADSPQEVNAIKNAALPYVALENIGQLTREVLKGARDLLAQLGPNEINYDALTHLINEMERVNEEIKTLKQEIAKGNVSPDIQNRFIELGNTVNRLIGQFARDSGDAFQLLGAMLDTLATVVGTWSKTATTPSLLIALRAAGVSLEGKSCEEGADSSTSGDIVEILLEALVQAIATGPEVAVSELSTLYEALLALRNET